MFNNKNAIWNFSVIDWCILKKIIAENWGEEEMFLTIFLYICLLVDWNSPSPKKNPRNCE